MKTTHPLYTTALLLTATVILCFLGFYNNFPFVFPDTGTYIFSGHNFTMPGDRPIIYGLFLRYISMLESLWFVVFVQAACLAYVLYTLFSTFVKSKKTLTALFLSYIFLITFFTGASINVSQLIPDIFTPVSILVIFLFLFAVELSIAQKIILFLIGAIGIATHNSHIPIVLALIGLFYCYKIMFNRIGLKADFLRHIKLLVPMLVCALLLNNVTSFILGEGFFPPSGSHVFLMSRMAGNGILERYLDENCAQKNYKICAYKNDIPVDFIWNFDASPIYKTGGWEANKEEYNAILSDMISTPKYLKKIIFRSIENGLSQLFSFTTGDTPQLNDKSAAGQAITNCFRDQDRLYHSSLQYNGRLNFDLLNNIQNYVVCIGLLSCLCIVFIPMGIDKTIVHLTIFLLVALLLNAFVCGCLSGVFPRYQSRVIWLLPIPLFISLFKTNYFKQLLNE